MTHPILSPDGLQLAYVRFRDSGGKEILFATRKSLDDSWSEPRPLPGLPTNGLDSPDITPDLLSLVVHRSGPDRKDSLFSSHRRSTKDGWPNLEPITGMEGRQFTGTMSNDRRLLIFSQGWKQDADLWMVRRKNMGDDWETPERIRSINYRGYDDRPRLLADGKSLLFSSDRPGGQGGMDLYLARLVRKEPLSDDPASLKKQAEEFVRLERCHEAIKAYEKLWNLPTADLNGKNRIMQGLYGRTFQWKLAFKHEQQRSTKGWEYAALLFQTGQLEDYRIARHAMLRDYRQVTNPHHHRMLLRIACLESCDEDLFPAIRSFAEKNLDPQNPPWHFATAGKGKYRLGEFQKWYDALPEDSLIRNNQDRTLLAMVAFQNDPSPKNRRLLQESIGCR